MSTRPAGIVDRDGKLVPSCGVIHRDYINDPDRVKYVDVVALERGRELTSNGLYIYVTQVNIYGVRRDGTESVRRQDVYHAPNGGLDDLFEAYCDEHPDCVRICIDIAVPDKKYLAGK